ncbi:choice-of-anchor J domain-containing protein [Jeotgalibacillus sp. R-1-5s-1]|uniref:choice-of-anchor J domain-containing protein n=1 Tax=Jeotgalibacillus sp. R-1-5s-1 TaxID=2555897 RepID=UPI001069E9B9|nr:choice-of-anchor J domain-containing protein [Jeotgalibacillus sp. R-1-5s-1]TFD92869.1 peptidase M6 [Jeotgalibacillus sp. R-1-5s-1]
MKKSSVVKVLSSSALVLSLFAPAALVPQKAEAAPANTDISNWNTERYGDRLDVDTYLQNLSEDQSYLKQAERKMKEQAAQLDAEEVTESEEGDENFTFDGGTKLFLDYNLQFKEYTLRSVGENVEVWVANDLSYPEGDPRGADVVTQEQVDKLTAEFDSNMYPVATDFFGTPDELDGSNSPLPEMVGLPEGYYEGSDKVLMMIDNVKDDAYYNPDYPFFVAGFFWQTLENYTDRNMITIDTNNWEERLESTFYATTIHELQHLIHADNDPAEETWLNEGMSTFSEFLGGYGHGEGSINFYLDHPENSLVNWDEHRNAPTGPETIADYGQVYLFTLYLYDKYGQEFIRELATATSQGITSVNEVFESNGIDQTFEGVYQNFITALALDSDRGNDGVYKFDSINLRDLPVDAEGTKRGKTINYENALEVEKEGVPAWGGDFKSIDFTKEVKGFTFNGADFLPQKWQSVADPLNTDNQVLWGNAGAESDNRLIFGADLTGVTEASLAFDHFYEIEEQWDFGTVQVSTDNGETWTSLGNENTRTDIVAEGYPTIKENLPGFTGTNGEWTSESFDLSSYAGQEILVAFRYMEDWGTSERGWFIDNVSLEAAGFEADGSSVDAFKSLDEIQGNFVNYTVTFIQERGKGNAPPKVIQVDPFNVTETKALELKQLFKDGNVKMITSYAAPEGVKSPVEFTYELLFKEDKGKGKGKKNKR